MFQLKVVRNDGDWSVYSFDTYDEAFEYVTHQINDVYSWDISECTEEICEACQ